MTDAYARLFAWKLSLHNVRATATGIRLHSRTFRAINGHRDAGSTACPGRYLYAKLPTIRTATQRIQDAAQSGGAAPTPTPTPTPTPEPEPTPSNTFTSPTQLPVTWTKQSTSLTFPESTNLTGSKHPDLVVKDKDGTIRLVPTGGQTGFAKAVSTPAKWSTMDLVSAVGDVTGDGKGDVLARLAQDKRTRVYVGDGAGHVAVPGTNPTAIFQWANFIVAAGDWNRDGRNDVLMRDKYQRLWMVPGLGGGKFGRGTVLHSAWGGWRSTAVAGDMTGDGRPDLLGIHHTGYIYLVPSTSTGKLSTAVRLRSASSSYGAILGGADDLSGDKVGDGVLVSSKTGQVSILTGAGRGALGGQLGWFDESKGLKSLGAAQMTGSGHPDLVGVNEAGTELLVVPHNGMTNLGASPASTLKVPGATQVLSVGDWNRDGRGDVITRESSGDVLVLHRGYADGRFARAVTLGKGWKSITHLAAVGDVTGDRNPDLAGRTSTGKTIFYPGDGKVGFLAPRTAPEAMKTFNQIGTGSWNPLITAGAAFISSDRSFVPVVGDKGGDPAGYDWVVGPGDVDGDGRNDLIGRDAAGLLWLLPGNGELHGPRRLIGSGFGIYSLGG
jgi:hypothetical protein